MISPSTPPGTKIVCIDVKPFSMVISGVTIVETVRDKLVLGQEYTLDEIEPVRASVMGGPMVATPYFLLTVTEITEMHPGGDQRLGFLSHRFRRRDLPESLARLQTALRKPAPALG